MAEGYISQTEIHKATGISKSTISTIYNNKTDMIKLETLNKLCNYLAITPADFFEFTPDEEF